VRESEFGGLLLFPFDLVSFPVLYHEEVEKGVGGRAKMDMVFGLGPLDATGTRWGWEVA
jgi:hypothetical protein